MSEIKQKGAGRPSIQPKRVTVTLSASCAEQLDNLAKESGVKLATYCAHVLERYALQGNEIMAHDVLIKRLEDRLDEHNTKFASRFADVILRIGHEVAADRRYKLIEGRDKYGKDMNEELRERSWKSAVKSMRKHVKHVLGEDSAKDQGEGDDETQ